MNKVILLGRICNDPEVRYSQGENAMCVARYRLAVDRKYGRTEEQTADFISCVAFGKNGEFAEKYLHKGMKIAVEGRIQTGSYTNKDGQKVYTTDVIGMKINIPTIPIKLAPTVTATSTQMEGSPTEFPTTCG